MLVPLASAADDHQQVNARALESAGAARLVEEHELERLPGVVRELLDDPQRLSEMEAAARRVGRPDAASRVADLLEDRAA